MPVDRGTLDKLKTEYKYGFRDDVKYLYATKPGLDEETVKEISKIKNEPSWMLDLRLRGLKLFLDKPMPKWGADLGQIDFDKIIYYMRPSDKSEQSWDDVPEAIKRTFDRLGIPEAEKRFLGGVGAQYESEIVYHSLREDLKKKGIIFLGMDQGLAEHPELVRKWFSKIVPVNDNKFAALNTAAWSGGSFIYVPPGVRVDVPLQSYFRINARNAGQFERTLIIADKGSFVHYVEGCTAPIYSSDSLHSAVVELVAMEGATIRYTTIQNWSNNVYNLVTKRGFAYRNSTISWIDGNLGSKITMKYPAVYLLEEGAKGEVLSVAFAGKGQHQDAGAKMVHKAPNTTSIITSKSVSKDGGRTTYRGLLKVNKGCHGVKSNVVCDALILDGRSATDTFPSMDVDETDVSIGHEASVGKVSEEQLFYLMSRGIDEAEAMAMIVRGFMEPFIKALPMEYAIELNRLIELNMEGSVG